MLMSFGMTFAVVPAAGNLQQVGMKEIIIQEMSSLRVEVSSTSEVSVNTWNSSSQVQFVRDILPSF